MSNIYEKQGNTQSLFKKKHSGHVFDNCCKNVYRQNMFSNEPFTKIVLAEERPRTVFAVRKNGIAVVFIYEFEIFESKTRF